METELEMGLERTGDGGNSLVVQWLGLCAFSAEGQGSIPGQGTKIPQAIWHSQTYTHTHTHTHTHEEQEMGWERKKNGTGNPVSVCEDTDSCEEMQGGLRSKG